MGSRAAGAAGAVGAAGTAGAAGATGAAGAGSAGAADAAGAGAAIGNTPTGSVGMVGAGAAVGNTPTGSVGTSSGDSRAADAAGTPPGDATSADVGTSFAAQNITRGTELAGSLEIAGSLWAKFMGLMGRPVLPPGHGLWLPASNGIHMMFMRFPIDAVFVGKAGATGTADPLPVPGTADGGEIRTVISVHRALRTWTGLVPLVRGAHGVLELPVGTIDASGTQVGDLIRLG